MEEDTEDTVDSLLLAAVTAAAAAMAAADGSLSAVVSLGLLDMMGVLTSSG